METSARHQSGPQKSPRGLEESQGGRRSHRRTGDALKALRRALLTAALALSAFTLRAETVSISSQPVPLPKVSTAAAAPTLQISPTTGTVVLEKVTIDDSGSRLLVLLQTSKPWNALFLSGAIRRLCSFNFKFASDRGRLAHSGGGIDPLTEIRYGYSSFPGTTAGMEEQKLNGIDYVELRLRRPVFITFSSRVGSLWWAGPHHHQNRSAGA